MHAASDLMLWAVLLDAQIVRWVVWVGLVVLTVVLLLLVRTRWGQSQPLGKCVVLSLLAHLLIGIYTTTVNIVTATVGSPEGKGIQVALIDGSDGGAPSADPSLREPLDTVTGDGLGAGLGPAIDLAPAVSASELPSVAEPRRTSAVDAAPPTTARVALPDVSARDDVAAPLFSPSRDLLVKPAIKQAEPIEVPSSESPKEEKPEPAPDKPQPAPAEGPSGGKPPADSKGAAKAGAANPSTVDRRDSPSAGAAAAQSGSAGGKGTTGSGAAKSLPQVFQPRVGDHLQVAKGLGATQDSEARVTAALRWLTANQSTSGRWEARRSGGGGARAADHEDRQGAGAQADTGITGLALLAFLAAGHTHVQGPHQTTVRRGLSYLLAVQDADGCLGVTSNRYERMYCHAMATCALSEALAMTGDDWLAPAVRRAVRYTVLAQDRVSGGWRYQPGDPGDTSQLGWQVMALKSAELAGIAMTDETREGVRRFLKSVAAGRNGGLARYQPGRGTVSRSMTAEALVCRQFMGFTPSGESTDEASNYLLQDLPGSGVANVYYWYYATLAMCQLQGEPWQRWNEALQKNLFATQRVDGELAGSWDPDPVWGGCGGRAYSTALSALCLEVYYRFLPLYVQAAGREPRAKSR